MIRNDKVRFFTNLSDWNNGLGEWRSMQVVYGPRNPNLECCARDSKTNFCCSRELAKEDYHYEVIPRPGDTRYLAFCKAHWELGYHD